MHRNHSFLFVASILWLLFAAVAVHAQSWNTPQMLNDPANNAGAVKDVAIYPASSGGFHATYRYMPSGSSQIKYRRHTGSGLLAEKQVHSVGFASAGDICEAGNGDIHIVWENWDATPDIGWAKSSNGGTTFTTATEITNFTDVGKIPLVSPFGAANSPDVVMVCGKANGRQVWYNHYNGTSWSGTGGYGQSTGIGYNSEYELFGITRSLQDGNVYHSNARSAALWYMLYNGSGWSQYQVDNTSEDLYARQSIAVNAAGQTMVVWEEIDLVSKLYTPGIGWGPKTIIQTSSGQAAVTALPNSNDFYVAYAKSVNRVRGKRWVGLGWGPEETVSVGMANAHTVSTNVAAGPDGTLYCSWEYWGSGDARAWFTSRPQPTLAYQATLVSANWPTTATPGQLIPITLTFRNTGTASWNTAGTKVGCSNPRDRSSVFYNSADWQAAHRPTAADAAVAPGQTGTFTFIAKAPATAGIYTEHFELVQEGVTWFEDNGDNAVWTINVMQTTPIITDMHLSRPMLLADGTTQYQLSMQISDGNGANDIAAAAAMFNRDWGNYDNNRGFIAWGKTQNDVALISGTLTVMGTATGGGYWAFDQSGWGYPYITPTACSVSANGVIRTVTWTFKVMPAWFAAGPIMGNYVGLFAKDATTNTGWKDSSTQFNYRFKVSDHMAAADFNQDSVVDAVDFDTFSGCYNGPVRNVTGDCLSVDMNGDHHVDAIDFDIFSGCYNGPVAPPKC